MLTESSGHGEAEAQRIAKDKLESEGDKIRAISRATNSSLPETMPSMLC